MSMTGSIRCCAIAAAFAATAAGMSAQTLATPPTFPTFPTLPTLPTFPTPNRLDGYLHDLARPGTLAGIIGGSVLDQMRHSTHGPPELADKIAQRAARRSVVVSVRDGMAALMHVSPHSRYQFCQCRGFGRKVGHALLESFTTRRDDGSRVPAIPRFASSYAGGLTGLAWNHDRTAGQVVLGTTLSFGINALVNVAKELAPSWHLRLPLVHDVTIPFSK